MISHSKTITTLATDYTQKINNETSLDGLQSLARVEHSNFQDWYKGNKDRPILLWQKKTKKKER